MLVIGGGITGIQASIDLANAGAKVVLVERSPAIGGKMAALDKNFPTLDCSICIEAPKMSELVQNQNIEVLTLAQVREIRGHPGDFTVTVHEEPRYVTSECTRCNDCVPVCPQIQRNEFDVGMGARKAIYTPYEQAEPGAYVVDVNTCLNEPPNYLPCNRCVEACAPSCIDFSMTGRDMTRNVAAVIAATGFELLDAAKIPEYGYGTHPDIVTSMEFERLLQASGPSKGEIIRPSNGKHPEKILFVLCVGSRDTRHLSYCSRICCMYSIKEALQAVDHGIKDVTALYMDVRAYGKGFDEFYMRSRKEGVRYVRGKPSRIKPNGDGIEVRYEDTERGSIVKDVFDMVVLAPAVIPSAGSADLAKTLGIALDRDGFFKASEFGGDLISTARAGIYVAGCSSGPKDIPDSVTEASGAAANALAHIIGRTWPQEPEVEVIDPTGPPRIGVFACDCGSNIAGVVAVSQVVDFAKTLPDVVHAERLRFACAANTQEQIRRTITDRGLNRVVVAACSPKTHGPTFQNVCARAGLNPYLFDMANVRNQDSWVHKHEREQATAKAKDLVKMSVEKARRLQALSTVKSPVVQRALVVGGGVAGMTCAIGLARQGFDTHLVETQQQLGGVTRSLDEIAPSGLEGKKLVALKEAELVRTGVNVHTSARVENISGFVGNFNAHLSDGQDLDFGAVVLATGAAPYSPKDFDYGQNPRVTTSLELEGKIGEIHSDTVTFLACVGSRIDGKGCSRFCCQTMIQQALRLRERGKRVRVVYRDIRTFTRHAEEMYEQACLKGVQFYQIGQDNAPNTIRYENNSLTFFDELTESEVTVPTDLLVLNVGLNPAIEENGVAQQLKVSRDSEGFLLESHPKLAPVEAAVQGVMLAGTVQGPKDVRESVAQGLATAAKAARILSRTEIEQEPLAAIVDLDRCTFCQRCVPVCPYTAIRGELRKSLEIIQAMCMGCGACAAECTVDAIRMPGFTDDQVIAQIDAATEENPEGKVIVFACNWCSYAGADQAGIAKIQYPSSVRIIRSMCSARIAQKFAMHAFARRAAAVLVTGCHIGDCHYINANHHTEKRIERWIRLLQMRGVDPRRLQLWWVSAAEGKRFAQKAIEMDELIRSIPREEIEATPTKVASFLGRVAS